MSACAHYPSKFPLKQCKNQLFDLDFIFTPSDSFSLGRTVLPQYKTLQTDRQTDRQTTHRAKGTIDSTVGQKQHLVHRLNQPMNLTMQPDCATGCGHSDTGHSLWSLTQVRTRSTE